MLNAEGQCADMATIKSSFTSPGAGTETFKAMTPTGTLYDAFKHIDRQIFAMILSGVAQMRNAAEDLSNVGFNEVKRLILHKGSYREYWKNGRKRMSSQPGQPPAAERGGTLEPSIYQQVISRPNQNPAVAEFGTTAPFAAELEFGTTRIQPRPFMRPARENVARVAQQHVARHLQIAYSRKIKSNKNNTFTLDMDM